MKETEQTALYNATCDCHACRQLPSVVIQLGIHYPISKKQSYSTQVFFSDLYNYVVNSCIVASDMCLPKTGVTKGSSKVIPGWNEHVQTQQDTSLFWHDIWVQCGRPHNGEVADMWPF